MNLKIISIFLLFSICVSFGQNTDKVTNLKQLTYMKNAIKENCSSTDGTTIEHKICLNFELQEIDAEMLRHFNQFLTLAKTDSIKVQLKEYQRIWEQNRSLQSKILSQGYRGHLLGIRYLLAMIAITKSRNKELIMLLSMEENPW